MPRAMFQNDIVHQGDLRPIAGSTRPLSGTGTGTYAAYDFRANMVPLLNCIWDVRVKDADYDLMRQLCEQFRQVANCYLGDYYPLTPYSLETSSWMGWQFDRPDLGTGMVQVFRRSESIYKAADMRLHALDPEFGDVLVAGGRGD